MDKQDKNTLTLLLQLYEYDAAYQLALNIQQTPKELLDLLYMLKERRELNVEPAFKMDLVMNPNPSDEQLANYLLDLEAKVKKGQIIDFVRAVSPLIYRLFMRLVLEKIPDIKSYIEDNKDDRYDKWKKEALENSSHEILRSFKPERNVTSNSLASLIVALDFSKDIKTAVVNLRQLERSVRNPLAHLIKPFDEEELKSTTNFSSATFLKTLIALARLTGVHYDSPFYFDTINLNIFETFHLSEKTGSRL